MIRGLNAPLLPRNTIHRILLRRDLIRVANQRSATLQRFERKRPNQLWQMDFKGPKDWPQPVGPLSVLDDHSRYLIALTANGNTRGEPVQHQLEEAFQRCGVPEEMLMDHGSPWWGHLSPLGHTHLSLWLMRQGIRLLGFVFAIRKRKARSSDFTDPCSEHWSEEEFRSKICKPGSTITDGSTIRCDHTKRST